MRFFSGLFLLAAQTLAQGITLQPSTVTAGDLTPILLTLNGKLDCQDAKYSQIKVLISGKQINSLIYSQNLNVIKIVGQLSDSDIIEGYGGRSLTYIFSSGSGTNLTTGFSYFNLNPTAAETGYTVHVTCVALRDNKVVSSKDLLTQSLNITVKAPPALPKVIRLSPSETNSTHVLNVTLSAPWPKQCRNCKNPVIKLSLDAETIKDGGALSSELNPDYSIQGFKGITKEELIKNNPDKKIKAGWFSSLEFKRLSYDLHNQFNLTFEFLGQQVPAQEVKEAHLGVQFICGNSEVETYTKEGRNAPKIKVNHAISIPLDLAFPKILLITLLLFVH